MKSPWALIGWLLAGLLGLSVSIGLYLVGQAMGWHPWLAPLLLWAPLLIAGLCRILILTILRPRIPYVPTLDPSNPFTGQWEALKSGLGEGIWELYLLVGDDDESKRSFLNRAMGEAEYHSAPSGLNGLAIWASEGRAWLNAPAALWHDQSGGESSGACGGGWAHLLKLLPSFPGRLGGLVVLLDPQKLANDPENQGLILSRRLSGLASLPGPLPLWWLILYPLENMASGQRLEQALKLLANHKDEMWQRPFGQFLSRRNQAGQTLPQLIDKAQSSLAALLNDYLNKIDCWPSVPQLSGQIFSFMDEFRELPLHLLTGEIDSNEKRRKIKCDGLFLALNSPDGGGQFNQMLLKHLIPGRLAARNAPELKPRKHLIIGAGLALFLAALITSGTGHWRGSQTLSLAEDIFPLLTQLERQPIAPPPITSLAIGSDLIIKLENEASGLAGIYRAPNKSFQQARSAMARQLNKHLPQEYSQYPAFIKALCNWSDAGSTPLVFKHTAAQVVVPGFSTISGRARVVELSRNWDIILNMRQTSKMESLLSHYDLNVFEEWRYKAAEMADAVEATPEKIKQAASKGLYGQFVGLEFLKSAGAELNFISWRETPGWITAAKELEMINSLSELGDSSEVRRELASVLKRIQIEGTPLGTDGIEKIMRAAKAWKKYERAAYGLSAMAENPKGLALLAEEMFSGTQAPPERASIAALRQLSLDSLASLEDVSPIPSEPERELFEKLFYSPVNWLAKSSIAAAATLLEDEWNRKIILPSKDLPEAEKVALLLGEDGAVAAFRDGPARYYLIAEKKGYRPAEIFGEKFPWSNEFLKFINASQESWKKMASSDGRLKISAHLRPVRAEGDLLINHPLGVAMEMTCEAEQFKSETYNQPAAFIANWSPKTCGPLKITVVFRDFKLIKTYDGSKEFANFIKAAIQGELRYAPDDFPAQRQLMKAAGADFVVISVDVDNAKEILKALTTPAPVLKPPPSIISS